MLSTLVMSAGVARTRQFGTLLGLVSLSVVLWILTPHFLTVSNLLNVLEQSAINAIVAAGGTPAPIVEKLSADVRAIVASEAFREKTKNLGINAYGNTPAELSAWMLREIERWKEVAKAANIKAE